MAKENVGINFIIILILVLLTINACAVNMFAREPNTDEYGCSYDIKSFHSNDGSKLNMWVGYIPCFFISPAVRISFLEPVETPGSGLRVSIVNVKDENKPLAISQLYNQPIIICLPFTSSCRVYGRPDNSERYSNNWHLLTGDLAAFKHRYNSSDKKTVKLIYSENTFSYSDDSYERNRFILGYPSNYFDYIKSYDVYKYFNEIYINIYDSILIVLYYVGQLFNIILILTVIFFMLINYSRLYILLPSALLFIMVELYLSLLFFTNYDYQNNEIKISCILVNVISFIYGYNLYLIKKKFFLMY